MQIVIDRDKEVNKLKEMLDTLTDKKDLQSVRFAINILENIDGIPLPEHHGRLIDADEAIKTLKSLGNRDYRREKGTIQDAEKMLSSYKYTPTIIEADKESEE